MRHFIAILMLLPIFAFSTSAVSLDDKQPLTAAEIIKKHLAAVGGKEALAKLKTRMVLGSVKKEGEPEVPVAIASEPNRISALYRFRDYDWRFIYDGTKADNRPALPRQLSVVRDKYIEMVASGLMFNSISLYNIFTEAEPGSVKFEAKGMKKLRGRPAYVIEVRRNKSEPMRVYFDSETFMWVRTDFGRVNIRKPQVTAANLNDVTSHAEDDVEVDFYIETSDFRDVDGIKLPFKFEQVTTYPILQQKIAGTITGTIREYVHNLNIDPKSYQ